MGIKFEVQSSEVHDGVAITVAAAGAAITASRFDIDIDDLGAAIIDEMVAVASSHLHELVERRDAGEEADEDEGLREGAAFTLAAPQAGVKIAESAAYYLSNATIVRGLNNWMTSYSEDPEGYEAQHKTIIRHLAEVADGVEPSYGDEGLALIRDFAGVGRAAAVDDDTITIPNAEYADLLDAKRRAETSLAACRAALQSVPEVGAVTLRDGTVAQVRVESYAALEAIWNALGNFPYERPASERFDDPVGGEISLEDFVAATTAGVLDMSDVVQDDGGPVEPELDIDGLILGKVKSSVFNSELYESLDDVQKLRAELAAATARADALEAEKAEALASVAGFESSPDGETTYTVRYGDASLTVTGSASGVAHLVKLAHGGFEYGVAA